MPLTPLKCPSCGSDIELDSSREFGFCMYCGTKIMLSQHVVVRHTGSVDVLGSEIDRKVASAEKMVEIGEYGEAVRLMNDVIRDAPDCGKAWLIKALYEGNGPWSHYSPENVQYFSDCYLWRREGMDLMTMPRQQILQAMIDHYLASDQNMARAVKLLGKEALAAQEKKCREIAAVTAELFRLADPVIEMAVRNLDSLSVYSNVTIERELGLHLHSRGTIFLADPAGFVLYREMHYKKTRFGHKYVPGDEHTMRILAADRQGKLYLASDTGQIESWTAG